LDNIKAMRDSTIGFSRIPDDQILEYANNCGANHYGRLGLVVRKSEGVWLANIEGEKYLDCLAAYSAANQGHHHPKIVQAVVNALQGHYGSVISNMVYSDAMGLFLRKLANTIPQLGPRFGNNGNKVLPKNGGVESVETSLKFARYYGFKAKGIPDGMQEIIVFDNNFHAANDTCFSFSTYLRRSLHSANMSLISFMATAQRASFRASLREEPPAPSSFLS